LRLVRLSYMWPESIGDWIELSGCVDSDIWLTCQGLNMVLVCVAFHYHVRENILLVVWGSRTEVNLLKPSSYCMYHQVCHSFLKVRTHSVFLYFVYNSEQVTIISLSRLKWSVLQLRWRMQTEIQVERLNIIRVNISLQKG